MDHAASSLREGSLILDAGAGPSPYKNKFKHCDYESLDFTDSGETTYVSSLDKTPIADNYYDAIICTEVLEHVPNPSAVIKELSRILVPGGKLFITVPLTWCIHQEPYDFYRYTPYSLKRLLLENNFWEENIIIKPKGGYFWMLSNVIRDNGLFSKWNPLKYLLYPFYGILLPLILFHLDILDRKKVWTNGYLVEVRK